MVHILLLSLRILGNRLLMSESCRVALLGICGRMTDIYSILARMLDSFSLILLVGAGIAGLVLGML